MFTCCPVHLRKGTPALLACLNVRRISHQNFRKGRWCECSKHWSNFSEGDHWPEASFMVLIYTHTSKVQHLNQQQSISFCSVSIMMTGNKDALAPCDRKLNGAGESWSFLAQQKLWGKKSVFVSNYNPLGAGVVFSTRQQLTKSDSCMITTVAGL